MRAGTAPPCPRSVAVLNRQPNELVLLDADIGEVTGPHPAAEAANGTIFVANALG